MTIPKSVTTIGSRAFERCYALTNITVDPLNSAFSNVGGVLFNHDQTTLVQYPGGKAGGYTIPNTVTNIEGYAFYFCINVTSVTIPNSVTSIGDYAFYSCPGLTSLYFQGNAPSLSGSVFDGDNVTIYYLPGTTGWGSTFGGVPTALWTLPYSVILNSSLGVQTNQFGFTVSWATNLNVVVEAATDLAKPIWSPVQTNTLTSGWFYFSDLLWKNYPARFYRIRSQ